MSPGEKLLSPKMNHEKKNNMITWHIYGVWLEVANSDIHTIGLPTAPPVGGEKAPLSPATLFRYLQKKTQREETKCSLPRPTTCMTGIIDSTEAISEKTRK